MEKLTLEEIQIFRKMPAAKKLKIANDMYFTAYNLKFAALKQQYPDWNDLKIKKEITRIFSYAGQ